MDVNLTKDALDAAVELGKLVSSPAGVANTTEEIHYTILPKAGGNFELVSLEKFQFPQGQPPERIRATPAFQDSASFCRYINEYKQEDYLQVFADASDVRMKAILDYHGAPDGPSFCQHCPTWQLTLSPQWQIWFGRHDQLIKQVDFAEFIEDNYRDIESPAPAVMLEVARELVAHSEVNFESKINQKDGTANLRWTEDTKTTGNTEVPDRFRICIPVFFGEQPVTIDCILRFRIRDGKLSFQYKMYRPAETKLEAFKFAVSGVSESIGIVVHLGTAGI